MDGEFADWGDVPIAYSDPTTRGDSAGIDLGRLWITNDEHYLFMRLEVGGELSLQDGNDLVLYVDTDNSPATGLAVGGLGAELSWAFGRRRGLFVNGADTASIEHQHIGLLTAPTVTSTEFEIVLDRDAYPAPGVPLFPGEVIRVAFSVVNDGGDVLPDAVGGVTYTFAETVQPATPVLSLGKSDPGHLRVLSYNTNNRMFRRRREAAYRRILRAIEPDILTLQEVKDRSAQETADFVSAVLPVPPSGAWHHARAGGEASVVLSPFPIASVYTLGQSAAFLLDLRPSYDTQLLLVVLSPPCCDRNGPRQRELDHIMSFVRDARSPGGEIDLEPDTPIVLIGDANLVGYAQQRNTLLTGEIVNLEEFGPSFAPDWDGTSFEDLMPRHTHRPVTFTWSGRDFSPGRLDYVVYSDAVLKVGNRFVLFTPEMPGEVLEQYGLLRDDTSVATDHLPIVVDFVLPGSVKP